MPPTNPPAGRALQPPARPLPSLHPPCNASLRGWECGAPSRAPRVLRACRRFFLWRRRRRRALGFASLAGGWQPPAPLLPPTGSQTARPFPPYRTRSLADRSAAHPPCPYGMPLATFVPSAQPRVREAASLRSATPRLSAAGFPRLSAAGLPSPDGYGNHAGCNGHAGCDKIFYFCWCLPFVFFVFSRASVRGGGARPSSTLRLWRLPPRFARGRAPPSGRPPRVPVLRLSLVCGGGARPSSTLRLWRLPPRFARGRAPPSGRPLRVPATRKPPRSALLPLA